MDFSENYEIFHKIEIQSDHWNHEQVTLFITISHVRVEGKWRAEAHIFVSADKSHDTYFVQRAMESLAAHFARRNIKPAAWYFNTDGAPSHFKNKFTMQSLFKFKTTSGASTVVWETCAPGHGKGPWDGIGAVVKRLLRQLERFDQVYAAGPRDVFAALVAHAERANHTVGSGVVLADIVYHYIRTANEPVFSDISNSNVWPPAARPAAQPNVTSVPHIRSRFCFRVIGQDVLAVRELSCRCKHCIAWRWSECKSKDAGEWTRVTMQCIPAAAARKTRSQRSLESAQRRKLAAALVKNEVFALESADDPEGFSFWLAAAEGPSFTHTGPKETVKGVALVRGGQYINLRYYNRFPPTSSSVFKLSLEVHCIDAEGIISRKVQFSDSQIRRSGRKQSSNPCPAVITLSEEQIRIRDDLPRLDEMV